MKSTLLLATLFLFQIGLVRAEGAPQNPDAAFIERVRTLLYLEDTAGSGNPAAPALEKQMLQELAQAAQIYHGPGYAPSPRAINAALALTLSGGPPAFAEELLRRGNLQPIPERLLEAAIAFKRGDSKRAADYLSGIDAIHLAPSTGGRVALMQAMLSPEDREEERQRLFMLAASLMPGTLIEDAALRRAALAAAKAHDYSRMWKIAERYVRRMSKSLYARQFIDALMDEIVAIPEDVLFGDSNKLEHFLNLLEREIRTERYLAITAQATARGDQKLVEFAAVRASREAVEGTPAWQRARLYGAAWGIAGKEYERHLDALGKLNQPALDPEERELAVAAADVARQIRGVSSVEVSIALPAGEEELTADQERLLKSADAASRSADATLLGAGAP